MGGGGKSPEGLGPKGFMPGSFWEMIWETIFHPFKKSRHLYQLWRFVRASNVMVSMTHDLLPHPHLFASD